jgi:hypothetical protein
MTNDSGSNHRPERNTRADHPLGAVARFLGHSAAAALGFAGLTAISVVPKSMLRVLRDLGFDEVGISLHPLEAVLQIIDAMLFLAVFLTGAAVFIAEVLADAERRIIEILQRRRS